MDLLSSVSYFSSCSLHLLLGRSSSPLPSLLGAREEANMRSSGCFEDAKFVSRLGVSLTSANSRDSTRQRSASLKRCLKTEASPRPTGAWPDSQAAASIALAALAARERESPDANLLNRLENNTSGGGAYSPSSGDGSGSHGPPHHTERLRTLTAVSVLAAALLCFPRSRTWPSAASRRTSRRTAA